MLSREPQSLQDREKVVQRSLQDREPARGQRMLNRKCAEGRNVPDSLGRECLAYFRNHPVFGKLFLGFREKYASYGTFSGKVTLRNVTGEEIEDLEGFFQQNYHGRKTVTISAERFERALQGSRFGGLLPKEVLELYFQEELTAKKEQRQEEARRWEQTFADVRTKYAGTAAEEWLLEIEGASSCGAKAYLKKRYRESGKDMQEVGRLLRLSAEIINGFPCRQKKTEYLAVFAARLTGNPHSFDAGTAEGQLLYLLVQRLAERQQTALEGFGLFPALHRQRQYLVAGILKDDVSNYVMLSGVHAVKKNGKPHAGMEGFAMEGDMVHVPLSVIAGWERVNCPDGEIYIVENPSVYALLSGTWRGERACMCMNGQPRLSAVLLLDLLAQAGVNVYYGGDFDPEGLLIAQKVKQYYRGTCNYWHMSAAEYERSRSRERISDKRLKMLDRIVDEQLLAVTDAIRQAKVAGYQENVVGVECDSMQ